MTKRLALMLAAALAACQPALQTPMPAVTATQPGVQDGGFTVLARIAGQGAGSNYHVAFSLGEVETLVVGIFDRATGTGIVPSLGYFNPNGAGSTATNPLSAGEFSALQGVLGTTQSVGVADKAEPRRYLFRTFDNPATTTPTAVNLTNFPDVSGTPAHAYNVFVCALDSYGTVIGYTEQDLTAGILAAGTVAMTVDLSRGGLGTIDATSTTNGSEFDPLVGLESLLVGTFDTGSAPHLGLINNGTTNVAFDGSQNWFTALGDFMTAQGMSDVANTRRYLIRQYASPVAGGARTTTSTNVPVASTYRSFILAVRDGGVDAGHALSAADASPNTTAPIEVALGAFTAGWIGTFAGDGTAAYLEGTGTAAQFNGPQGAFVDAASNVFVADTGNHRIRQITSAGVTSLVAGGAAGYVESAWGTPLFDTPRAVVKDSLGNLFVADAANNCIRKIDPAGVVSTLAGNGTAGNLEGVGPAARLTDPSGLAIDSGDNLFVADAGSHNIKKIPTSGVNTGLVSIVAGDNAASPQRTYLEGRGTAARFDTPRGVAVTSDGSTVYVADTGNNRVRMIDTTTGDTSLVAGSASSVHADGTGASAGISAPWGIALDSVDGYLYLSDANNRIRKVVLANSAMTTAAGDGTGQWLDGAVTSARVNGPSGLYLDSSMRLFFADTGSNRIRRLQ